MKRLFWSLCFHVLTLGVLIPPAHALVPVGARIEVVPSSNFNFEFGLFYSSTGRLPARLVLLCEHQVSEPDWDGIAPTQSECGSTEVLVRIRSFGLLAFLSNYSKENPLIIGIHVDPTSTPLRSVLGNYIGGELGGGLVAGGRTMVFVNQSSGVWATAVQTMRPSSGQKSGAINGDSDADAKEGVDGADGTQGNQKKAAKNERGKTSESGFDAGFAIGIPRLEVFLKSSHDLDVKLSSLQSFGARPSGLSRNLTQAYGPQY